MADKEKTVRLPLRVTCASGLIDVEDARGEEVPFDGVFHDGAVRVAGRVLSAVYTLHDDESVRKKLSVMSKWEAMTDDSRNPEEDFEKTVEDFIKLGKSYRVIVQEVEVEDAGREVGS